MSRGVFMKREEVMRFLSSGALAVLICLFIPLTSDTLFAVQAVEEPPAELTFGLNLRARYEFQDNFNQKYYGDHPAQGEANDGYLLGRLRAGLDWRPTDNIHLALWGQHADAWDYELPDEAFYNKTFKRINHPQKDRWELYETYLEVKELLAPGFAIKAGRQKIYYGDKRVFGPGEWGNSGRWIWDAVKLSWSFQRGFVDMFYGRTMLHQINQFSLDHRHGYDSIGLYAHFDLLQKPAKVILEPMLFTKTDNHDNYAGEVDKTPGDLEAWYVGARLHAAAKGTEFGGTFLQEKGDFASDSIDAYGYHVMLAHTFPVAWTPKLGVAYSYASGDSDPTDGENETFDGAFGAKDKMYGRMNLFCWSNLRDLEANLTLKPRPGVSITAEVHQFKLAESRDAWYLNKSLYRDKSGQSGDEVGKEFDIVAAWKVNDDHKLMTGFGHFWPDEFAENLASDKQANWVFFQWEYNFSTSLL